MFKQSLDKLISDHLVQRMHDDSEAVVVGHRQLLKDDGNPSGAVVYTLTTGDPNRGRTLVLPNVFPASNLPNRTLSTGSVCGVNYSKGNINDTIITTEIPPLSWWDKLKSMVISFFTHKTADLDAEVDTTKHVDLDVGDPSAYNRPDLYYRELAMVDIYDMNNYDIIEGEGTAHVA